MNVYLFLSITFFVISILTSSYKTKHIYNALFNALLIFLYLVITIMYFSADYFTGKGITQAVLFTLETGLEGAGFGEYILLISVSIFLFVLVVAISYLYLRFIKHRIHPKPKRIKGTIHNTFLLLAFLSHPFNLDLYSIYNSMHVKQSTDFYQYYKKPNLSVKQTKNYNLVYIYAESLEKTYFNESIFPNLMPNLTELKKNATEFTDINQIVATGWTIGGMAATQCAIPLFTTSQGNSMDGTDSFLSGAGCLGDVLKNKDYHLFFMQGSSVEFSGMRKLYFTHHFDEVYGLEELQKFIIDKNYKNGWGLYDDTLFPLVYKKFEELSKINKPFALFAATIDTHHPEGMTSKSCSNIPYNNGENSILNAVHCSDYLISQFIKKIQNSKYADKTLIVLTSDHLAMRNTATDLLSRGDRKDLFLIFDPAKKQYIPIDKVGSMLDVGPTILSKLGINTDFGLGRNLFNEESLLNKFDNFNKKLLSWRESILKLWRFAILGRKYTVDTSLRKVHIGLHEYRLPILITINKDNSIIPFFEFNFQKRLNEYIVKFDPNQKFIWIDSCAEIYNIFDIDQKGKLCVVQGTLSSTIEAKSLNDGKTTINTISFLQSSEYNTLLYKKRVNKLQKILECKHPAARKVSIRSSSMPILHHVPGLIRTSEQQFGISRGLNLLTIDHDGEYQVQYFDVYGSQEAANDLVKTIKLLIEKKRFWALAAYDAIKNTYPGYQESLKQLGFELLPTLDLRVAYIGYSDKDGNIHEFSDINTICEVVDSFKN